MDESAELASPAAASKCEPTELEEATLYTNPDGPGSHAPQSLEQSQLEAKQREWQDKTAKAKKRVQPTSRSFSLRWLQKECVEKKLWAGGHQAQMCDRLARWELGMESTPLESAHAVLHRGTVVKMLFSDGVWWVGSIYWVAVDTIDLVFLDDAVEEEVPLVVDGATLGHFCIYACRRFGSR